MRRSWQVGRRVRSFPALRSGIARWVLVLAAATWPAAAADSLPGDGSPASLFRYFPRPAPSTVATSPHPAVVRVLVDEARSQANGTGSFVAARDRYGLVITNWHVVRDAAGKIEVVFANGFRSAATVLKTDRDWDLAALLIWRPAVAPLPVSTVAPQPGDPLTIAGYGPGDYRAVTGKCTQYVAPSDRHPFEIVELSAQARQGDSGGPILNDRGELAGVLFGASRGSTSGSYCGRVRAFLAPVWPNLDESPPAEPASPRPPPETTMPLVGFDAAASSKPAEVQPVTPLVPVEPRAEDGPVPPVEPRLAAAAPPSDEPDRGAPPIVYTPLPPAETPPAASFSWEKFAGNTPFDQAKTVLAIIGVLTLWGHLARWLTR